MTDTISFAEGELDTPVLLNAFLRADFDVNADEEGQPYIQKDGPPVFIGADGPNGVVEYLSVVELNDSQAWEAKSAIAGKLTELVPFCRFHVPQDRPELLIVNHHFVMVDGYPRQALYDAYGHFSRAFEAAVKVCHRAEILASH